MRILTWLVPFALLASPATAQVRTPVTRLAPRPAAAPAPTVMAARCEPGDRELFPVARLREREGWYGKHLRAAGEAPLCQAAGEEVYRFTWLRTFHNPVVVRVERTADRYRVVSRRLSGAGGYEPGRRVHDRAAPISAAEWHRLQALVDSAGIWRDGPPGRPLQGLDGAQWIVEARRGAEYRALDWWSPGADDAGRPVHRLGLLMLELADLLRFNEEMY